MVHGFLAGTQYVGASGGVDGYLYGNDTIGRQRCGLRGRLVRNGLPFRHGHGPCSPQNKVKAAKES